MKTYMLMASAALGLISATNAMAGKCNIVGSWTDTYGSVATFTTNTHGYATYKSQCTSPYKLVVSDLTRKTFDVTARAKACPTVTADLAFTEGDCDTASGTISTPSKSLSDTWTKTSASVHPIRVNTDSLTRSMR